MNKLAGGSRQSSAGARAPWQQHPDALYQAQVRDGKAVLWDAAVALLTLLC
jgi:hypothetical protein